MTGVVKFWNPEVDGWQVVGTGPRGDTGPPGPTGEMGPVGEVSVIACKMWRSAAFTPSTGVTVVPLDAVTFDTSNMADIANGRIRITTPGIYQVNATVNFNASGTGTYTYVSPYIMKNGATVSETFDQRAITNRGAAHISDMVTCVAGDYLQLGVYNQQGTALVIGDARNYLSVSLITAGVGPTGPTGATGPPGGPVPVGGIAGQIMQKQSDTDFDVVWTNPVAGRANMTATSQSIAAGATAAITGWTANLLEGGATVGTNGITVPKAALYAAHLNLMWNSEAVTSNQDRRAYLQMNGGNIGMDITRGGAGYISQSIGSIVRAPANAVFGAAVTNSDTAAKNAYGGTWTMLSVWEVR